MADDEYQSAGTAYINTDYKNPAFDRAGGYFTESFSAGSTRWCPMRQNLKRQGVWIQVKAS